MKCPKCNTQNPEKEWGCEDLRHKNFWVHNETSKDPSPQDIERAFDKACGADKCPLCQSSLMPILNGVIKCGSCKYKWYDARHIKTPDAILKEMSEMFLERLELYGPSYLRIGKVMETLFPEGITLKTEKDHNLFHQFSLMQVKMVRLAKGELKHKDSARDIGVYAAMLESLL